MRFEVEAFRFLVELVSLATWRDCVVAVVWGSWVWFIRETRPTRPPG